MTAEQAGSDKPRRDPALQGFLDYVIAVNRGPQRGAFVIAVSMQELNAALHKGGARAALTGHLQEKARQLQARLFNLNERLYVLVPPQDEWDLVQIVYDVRVTVIKTVGREASELGLDPSTFTQVLHTRRDGQELRRLAEGAIRGHKGLRGPLGPSGPITRAHVEAVAAQAETVGAVTFVREFACMQAMARIRPAAEPEPRGHEIFISLRDMGRQLLPGVDMMADREVFQELTLLLDRLVLRSLSESRLVQGSVGINLNVDSLLTPEFERIAQRLYDRDGAALWVDLDIPDILANFETFRDARLVLRRFGVRTMAESTRPELVPTAEQRDLGLAGYKFIYPDDPDALNHMSGTLCRIREAERLAILTRVERDEAITAGQRLGIHHFQGFYINDLLSGFAERPVERD